MNRVSAKYIRGVTYYPIRKLLEIRFADDDNTYQYWDVPEEVWYGMRNTFSMDLFFNTQICTRYRCQCVEKEQGNR